MYLIIGIIIIIIILLLVNIKVTIKNTNFKNEISLSYLFFKVYFDYDKMVKKIKMIALKKRKSIKETVRKVLNSFSLSPLFISIAKRTTVEKTNVYKYIKIDKLTDYNYTLVTFYIIMAYIQSFLNQYTKKVNEMEYKFLFAEREDIDFEVVVKINILSILLAFLVNIKNVFGYWKKERLASGS